jgi:hypothetical protein
MVRVLDACVSQEAAGLRLESRLGCACVTIVIVRSDEVTKCFRVRTACNKDALGVSTRRFSSSSALAGLL